MPKVRQAIDLRGKKIDFTYKVFLSKYFVEWSI